MNETIKKQKAYIIKIKYKITEWRIWFMDEDTDSAELRWNKALNELEQIGANCSDSNNFYNAAVENFKKYGFKLIKG